MILVSACAVEGMVMVILRLGHRRERDSLGWGQENNELPLWTCLVFM